MATFSYNEVVTASSGGSVGSTGTYYTCPANKYARVSLIVENESSPLNKPVVNGVPLAVGAVYVFFLYAGQTLANNGSGGGADVVTTSYSIQEFDAP